MARKRFKTNAAASSYNYESHRRSHRDYIIKEHELNHVEVEKIHLEISVEITVTTPKKVLVFGKWIELGPCDPNSFQGFKLL